MMAASTVAALPPVVGYLGSALPTLRGTQTLAADGHEGRRPAGRLPRRPSFDGLPPAEREFDDLSWR
jgi:hypothetical protein